MLLMFVLLAIVVFFDPEAKTFNGPMMKMLLTPGEMLGAGGLAGQQEPFFEPASEPTLRSVPDEL